MQKGTAFIRNPLTVVGVFAGVAEVCAAWVLPRITPELQALFIWFVMGFPLLLVTLFFLTLNFNPRCLYSPSDFRDDAAFIDTIQGARRLTALEQQQSELTAIEAALTHENAQGTRDSDREES